MVQTVLNIIKLKQYLKRHGQGQMISCINLIIRNQCSKWSTDSIECQDLQGHHLNY